MASTNDNFFVRLVKLLRVLAWIALVLLSIIFYTEGNRTFKVGNTMNSTVTCSNGYTYSFSQLGIDASSYYSFTDELYYLDQQKINNYCGYGQNYYNLVYDTHKNSSNPFKDVMIFGAAGYLVIEGSYFALSYLFNIKK